jgi:Ser/Thr protein kinase RdoA (MazF antagonist)
MQGRYPAVSFTFDNSWEANFGLNKPDLPGLPSQDGRILPLDINTFEAAVGVIGPIKGDTVPHHLTQRTSSPFSFIPDANLPDEDDIVPFLEYHLGLINNITRIQAGVVHYVFRIETQSQTAYLKIRGPHFSGIQARSKPQDIKYEQKATAVLSRIAPNVFPQVIASDYSRGLLLITDVMPAHRDLKTYFESGLVETTLMYTIGQTLGDIHHRSAEIASLRGQNEKQSYDDNLFYRLGYYDHPILNRLVVQLNTLPKQLILGDHSPKNIGVGQDGQIVLYDLDAVHHGNTIFDVGFFLGHVLVHTLGHNGFDLIQAYLDGYNSHHYLEDIALKQIALGICLYRLDNDIVPYPLALSDDYKGYLINRILHLLRKTHLSWVELCQAFTLA